MYAKLLQILLNKLWTSPHFVINAWKYNKLLHSVPFPGGDQSIYCHVSSNMLDTHILNKTFWKCIIC